jgi:NTP pyrophosphatase (non-canonical NTP hydrolase)
MSLNQPERAPAPNANRPIWQMVIDDMRERDETGLRKYGTRLQAHNGRDADVDLYQELLDAVVYQRQKIAERAAERDGFVAAACRTEHTPEQYEAALKRIDAPMLRLMHVAMGLVTEAGEFIDALKAHIFYGKTLDRVNLIEELGDVSWYQRIGCAALEIEFREMLLRNVQKLQARFPEKFSEACATDRDLASERKVLEGPEQPK